MKKHYNLLSILLATIMGCAAMSNVAFITNDRRFEKCKVVLNFDNLDDGNLQAQYAASNWNGVSTYWHMTKSSSSNNTLSMGPLATTVNATTRTWTYTNRIFASDNRRMTSHIEIVFNEDRVWDYSSNTCQSNRMHFRSTARHELGHVASLAHSNVSGALMDGGNSAGNIRNITTDDSDGVNSIHTLTALTEDYTTTRSAPTDTEYIVHTYLNYPDWSGVKLAQQATDVITGTVVDIIPGFIAQTSDDLVVYSKVIIEVDETLKGTDKQRIAIPMYGGVYGDATYIYPDMPEYSVGEMVLLYLQPQKAQETAITPSLYSTADNTPTYMVVVGDKKQALNNEPYNKTENVLIAAAKADIIAAETYEEPIVTLIIDEYAEEDVLLPEEPLF